MMFNSKHKSILIIVSLLLLGAGVWLWTRSPVSAPTEDETTTWKVATSTEGATFKYPEELSATYIKAFDWPPEVAIIKENFSCTEAGEETARAGKTEKRVINGHEYCITTVTEGAAGSIYTQYAYAAEVDTDTIAIFTFSLRADQCGNYNDLKKEACENEREAFTVDNTLDRIARTLELPKGSTTTVGEFWGTITGSVLLGPTCPVERIPPDPNCADKAFETRLALTSRDQSKVIKEFSSDKQGRFSIEVPPGEYAIRSAAAANILPYCSTNDVVKVPVNGSAQVTVYCDSGIR